MDSNIRINALREYFEREYFEKSFEDFQNDETFEEIEDSLFSYDGGEYLVLTDEESTKLVRARIRDSLWAFNIDFISHYCDALNVSNVRNEFLNMQSKLCEDCNELIYALVENKYEQFVHDAIWTDGRGHFLSFYDGEESEIETDDGTFYVYRVN
jgi:hypothetical protein